MINSIFIEIYCPNIVYNIGTVNSIVYYNISYHNSCL